MAGYPGGPAGIFLSEVQCTGEEAQLSECTIGVRINTGPINCQHSEDVQLICLPPEIPTGEWQKLQPHKKNKLLHINYVFLLNYRLSESTSAL